MNLSTCRRWITVGIFTLACLVSDGMAAAAPKLEVIFKGDKATPRITYAMEQVRAACNEVSAKGILQVSVQDTDRLKSEGFRLKSLDNGSVEIVGADQSGVLYGCLELAERIRARKVKKLSLGARPGPSKA